MKIRFHPSASRELEASAVWYEAQEKGLGAELIQEFQSALLKILEGPQRWPLYPKVDRKLGVRRHPLQRFPYGIAYLSRDDEIIIVAISHDRRRPGYWTERVSD